MLTLSPKSEKYNNVENKIKREKKMKRNKIYYLQFWHLSKQGHTFYTNVNAIWSHETLSRNLSKILLYFLNLIQIYSTSKIILYSNYIM